jgi:IclR family transcriptional regulator, acetate operon repressor
MTSRPGDGTGSLEKAIDVLEEIGRQPGGITHSDLAQRLAMPRTTVYRLLATLVARGLARHDPSRRVYNLGVRYVELARQAFDMPDLVAAASQELRDLRDLTGETSYIGTLEGMAVVSLERYDGAHSHRKPIHATSQGKAWLAALSPAQRDELVSSLTLTPLTPLTLTDRRRLHAELRVIQTRGWAIDNEENVPGVRCVGAAVVDPHGVVRGAISVAGPAYRLPLSRIELLGPEIAEAARRIGARLEGASPQNEAMEAGALPTSPSLFGAFPQWSASRGQLLWADALAPALRMLEDGVDRPLVRLDRPVTGLFLRGDSACAVHEDGATEITPDGQTRPLSAWQPMPIQAVAPEPNGQAWVALAAPGGSVIGQVGADGGFRRRWGLDEPVECLQWSPDGRLLFAAAPESGSIFVLKPGADQIRRLASLPRGSGRISGLAVDAQGGVWTALRDGWSVVRLREDGSFDRSIPLPVPYPTGVAVGGRDGSELFVTSARQPVALDTLKAAPLSGRLFRVKL